MSEGGEGRASRTTSERPGSQTPPVQQQDDSKFVAAAMDTLLSTSPPQRSPSGKQKPGDAGEIEVNQSLKAGEQATLPPASEQFQQHKAQVVTQSQSSPSPLASLIQQPPASGVKGEVNPSRQAREQGTPPPLKAAQQQKIKHDIAKETQVAAESSIPQTSTRDNLGHGTVRGRRVQQIAAQQSTKKQAFRSGELETLPPSTEPPHQLPVDVNPLIPYILHDEVNKLARDVKLELEVNASKMLERQGISDHTPAALLQNTELDARQQYMHRKCVGFSHDQHRLTKCTALKSFIGGAVDELVLRKNIQILDNDVEEALRAQLKAEDLDNVEIDTTLRGIAYRLITRREWRNNNANVFAKDLGERTV